jgi:hypothetical protein
MKYRKSHHLWVEHPGIDPALVESLPPPLIAYSDAHSGRRPTLATALKSMKHSSCLRENPCKNARIMSGATIVLIFSVAVSLHKHFGE